MDFEALQIEIADLKQAKSRAEGRLEGVMSELKTVFGVSTLEEAEKALKELRKKLDAAEITYSKEKEAFLEKWGDLLNADI